MALRFGRKVRMQAGLVAKRRTLRDVFTAVAGFLLVAAPAIGVIWRCQELSQRFAVV
jgi:hypothetical protein